MPRQTQAPTTSSHSGLISGVLVTVIFIFISTVVIITTTIIIKQRSKKILHVSTGIALSNQIYGELPYVFYDITLIIVIQTNPMHVKCVFLYHTRCMDI